MNSNISQCHGLLGRIFGHKFRARFDETTSYPDASFEFGKAVNAKYPLASPLMESSVSDMYNTETAYIHDVCVRCGAVIPRGDKVVKSAPVPSADS